MAKFRQNHNSVRGSGGMVRAGGFLIFFIVVMLLLYKIINSDSLQFATGKEETVNRDVTLSDEKGKNIEKSFLPESSTGQVISHKHYTLSYHEDHEQAEWVSYLLTKASLKIKNVKRTDWYEADGAVPTQSAHHRDYSNSGYTRGHLAPAGDMAFSKEAMEESFFMSNMSPQLRPFNNGIWRELEEAVRDWAWDNEEVYIVTGPILKKDRISKKIGGNKVSVPELFYKVVLDVYGKEKKAIAFIIPNQKSEKHLREYAVSIDSVEELVGLDFFADFLDESLESQLESNYNTEKWRISDKRFQKRIKNWNNQ